MQNLFKFSDYDIFAYVVAGLALMIGADLVLGWDTIVRRDGSLTVGEGAVRVLGAYVLGMLVAGLSSRVLQRWLEHRVVGQPFGSLMRAADSAGWRSVFSSYHHPLSATVRARVKERLEKLQSWSAGDITKLETFPKGLLAGGDWLAMSERLFSAAHPSALRDSAAADRMETFLKLYGFCRNLAFVLLVCAVGFAVQCYRGIEAPQLGRSAGGSSVTVLVVPSDGTAARVADALKPKPGPDCKAFVTSQEDAKACGALWSHGWMAAATLLVALLLFGRFLYFHRLYAVEVLTAYSREKLPEPAQPLPPAAAILAAAGALVAAAQAAAAKA
jgi:hypothetical protein